MCIRDRLGGVAGDRAGAAQQVAGGARPAAQLFHAGGPGEGGEVGVAVEHAAQRGLGLFVLAEFEVGVGEHAVQGPPERRRLAGALGPAYGASEVVPRVGQRSHADHGVDVRLPVAGRPAQRAFERALGFGVVGGVGGAAALFEVHVAEARPGRRIVGVTAQAGLDGLDRSGEVVR